MNTINDMPSDKEVHPDQDNVTSYVDDGVVRVRKQYGVESLYIYAHSHESAFRTLADFIKEYKFYVRVCYIEPAVTTPFRDYKYKLVVHS